jgi:hypothetical protein
MDNTNHQANPLDPSPDTEQRIRERAYHLWREEGCPDGRDAEIWERARELQAIADSAGSGLLPISAGEPVIDEAELQENLGEFPDRFADQGEKTPTPRRRTRRKT